MNKDVWLSLRVCIIVLSLVFGSIESSDARERYLVQFKTNMGFAAQLDSLSRTSVHVLDYIPEVNIYVVESPDDAEMQMLDTELNYREKSMIWYLGESAPNDVRFKGQMNYNRLNLKKAWDINHGKKDIVVAVIDTGVDVEHEDLKANLWKNKDEIPDNQIDDDKNGYVDDTWGWNFDQNNNSPIDGNRHGTHVSGTIGAVGDNGIGIAGVNWSTSIMPLKFLSDRGSGVTENGIKATIYAANNGARVINASWGGGGPSRAMEDAIRYAYSKGTIFIAASGNSKANTDRKPHFPSSYDVPGLISVVATAGRGVLSSFSNYGSFSVDVGAPGSDIYSTLPGSLYGRLSGTSMATPMVTGVAALMLSEAGELTPLQLRNGIMNATVPFPAYKGKIATGGELSAEKALAQLQLDAGYQVWPSRHTVLVNKRFQFVTYNQSSRNQEWSVSDPKIASIDAQGNLSARRVGSVVVSVRDGPQIARTESIQIVPVPSKNRGGGGCFGRKSATISEDVSAAMSFSLPFLFGFVYCSRRRKKKIK